MKIQIEILNTVLPIQPLFSNWEQHFTLPSPWKLVPREVLLRAGSKIMSRDKHYTTSCAPCRMTPQLWHSLLSFWRSDLAPWAPLGQGRCRRVAGEKGSCGSSRTELAGPVSEVQAGPFSSFTPTCCSNAAKRIRNKKIRWWIMQYGKGDNAVFVGGWAMEHALGRSSLF